jgi:hypothetical protein
MRFCISSGVSVSPLNPFTCAQPVMPGLSRCPHHKIIDGGTVFFGMFKHMWPGTCNTHITHKYIKELREFVQAPFAHKGAYAGNACIIFCCLQFIALTVLLSYSLISDKRKVFLSLPNLICLKKTGPFDSNFMSTARMGINQEMMKIIINELTVISNNRFLNRLLKLSRAHCAT